MIQDGLLAARGVISGSRWLALMTQRIEMLKDIETVWTDTISECAMRVLEA